MLDEDPVEVEVYGPSLAVVLEFGGNTVAVVEASAMGPSPEPDLRKQAFFFMWPVRISLNIAPVFSAVMVNPVRD